MIKEDRRLYLWVSLLRSAGFFLAKKKEENKWRRLDSQKEISGKERIIRHE